MTRILLYCESITKVLTPSLQIVLKAPTSFAQFGRALHRKLEMCEDARLPNHHLLPGAFTPRGFGHDMLGDETCARAQVVPYHVTRNFCQAYPMSSIEFLVLVFIVTY